MILNAAEVSGLRSIQLFLQKLQFTTLPIIYNGYVGETFFNYVYLDLESSQTINN